MGIASLVLGILSFLIAFSWFGDLSLILAVIGMVLGIISIVKKKEKGMGIAGVVLAAIALILLFANFGSTEETGGVAPDSGNANFTKPIISTENIAMEKVGITKKGEFVIKVTNNNERPVCLSTITTVYKDKDGDFIKKTNASNYFVCIPAKASTLVYNYEFEENYSQYPNYEFSCELANISNFFVYENIEITSKDTGKQIAVTLKNNTENMLSDSQVVVAYYKNDEIVGIEEGISNNTTEVGKEDYINVDYPNDSRYNKISFDRYEVHFINAGIK